MNFPILKYPAVVTAHRELHSSADSFALSRRSAMLGLGASAVAMSALDSSLGAASQPTTAPSGGPGTAGWMGGRGDDGACTRRPQGSLPRNLHRLLPVLQRLLPSLQRGAAALHRKARSR